MCKVRIIGFAFGFFLTLPALALAQASLTGVAKDPSGAVLPGVTVEASSPALIEKARTSVTDGTGQYRVINLPPGSYTVVFTLNGFNTFRREGIVLSGSFTATVNADLAVGSVEQTVTVSAESAEGGVRLNIIPRDGGNTFNGTMFASYASEHLAASNLDDDLRSRGFVNPNTIKINGDLNPGFGGPLRKDRLWFYGSARYLRAAAYVGGMARDVTAKDLTVFRFNPDSAQRMANDATWKDGEARFTWQ